MAYDKNETRANCGKVGLGQKKYRFKWSLANGKKYLINYPKELLEKKG